MQNEIKKAKIRKTKRALRVRSHLTKGTSERPRFCVVKSNAHIRVQLIDDTNGITIASTSTVAKEFRNTEFNKKNIASATEIGKHIGKICKEKGVNHVIFDRGSSKYHGVLAAVANGARETGLQF